jgi:arabinofuranosyltransferase
VEMISVALGAIRDESTWRWKALLAATALTASMFALWYLLSGRAGHGIDDADITLTYARNLAEGYGYVYRPGGERVEGSTSLAWTLLCAGAYIVSGSNSSLLFALCVGFTALATFIGLELARQSSPPDSAKSSWIVAAACFVAAPAFFFWNTVTLMDSALWTACIALAVLAAIRFPRSSAWALSLASVGLIVIRPEGMLIAPLVLACAFIASVAAGASASNSARKLVVPLLITLITAGGLIAFRVVYFGFPLPNTYYAKVGTDSGLTCLRGGEYLLKFFLTQPLHLVSAWAVGRTLRVDGRALFTRLRARSVADDALVARVCCALIALAAPCLTLVEGGDHFAGGRMMQPFVPVALALLAARLGELFAMPGGRLRAIVPSLLVAAGLGTWLRFLRIDALVLKNEVAVASSQRRAGSELAKTFGRGGALPSIGVSAAGGIAYAYPGPVYDLLGLNWVTMAHASTERRGISGHSAFSARVFWAETPDLVSFRIVAQRPRGACDLYGEWAAWQDTFFRGLLSTDRFRRDFVAVAVPIRDGWLGGFARRAWVARSLPERGEVFEWPTDSTYRPGCNLAMTQLTSYER